MNPDAPHGTIRLLRPRAGAGLCDGAGASGRPGGFTLIELILVMVTMLVVLSLSAPSLSGFFRGRTLDSEARRLLSLTRYAQSRAAAESIPMVLWFDGSTRSYGLRAEYSFTGQDERAVEYVLSEDVLLEVEPSRGTDGRPVSSGTLPRSASVTEIRFQPDGFLGGASPEGFILRENLERAGISEALREAATVWIRQSPNRLCYRIETNTYALYR